ncbi:MAG: hypothetical protein HND44_15730 [Chloroflexi bacterium]|nr:hypothetical protein [Ardenticatenaceae bacterium]MBL1129913.1 hypothetical protein [Chloroflexota bacterium]NOG35998.1 hypothetical protein [Chloroflexota bacterium]GIK59102.1 MAG: hypothetical protein BroJett015_47650 [Chloroflexota bacterium]
MAVTPQQLNQFLNQHFSLDELQMLCFELNIPYEDLGGGESRAAKVLALVQYAQRHNLYDTVVTHAQAARPNARMGDMPSTSQVGIPATGQSSATPTAPVYNITVQGNMVGTAIGGNVQTGDIVSGDVNKNQYQAGGDMNIAGRDIIIGQPPQNRDEFAEQLKQLQSLLQEAIKQGEIVNPGDAKDAVDDVQDALDESQAENPDPDRITRKLEAASKILDKAEKVATTAGKVSTIALKAAPLAATLLKAVQTLF